MIFLAVAHHSLQTRDVNCTQTLKTQSRFVVALKVSWYHLGLANRTTLNSVLVFEVLRALEGNRLKEAQN